MKDSRLYASACAVAIAASAVVAAPAGAQMSAGGGGGTTFVAQPTVTKVACVRGCASKKRAKGGATVSITGRSLRGVTQVVFLGAGSKGDDAAVTVRSGSDTKLSVAVPVGAVSGSVAVVTATGTTSKPSPFVAILPAPPPEPNAVLSPVPGPRAAGAPGLETGTSRTQTYIGMRRAVTFSYRITDGQPTSMSVELVKALDGSVVKSWTPAAAVAGEVYNVSWDGSLGTVTAPPGRYSFRLTATGPTGAVARSSQGPETAERDAFDLYDNVFPVRGKHDYGGANADFGSGRAGHSHQGQDVFAKCGTRMVAARGGEVKFSAYQGSAGNYVVIDAAGTDEDYAYMHLEQPSPFKAGDHVYTGQQIGTVGDTGNASGCHLHFELWGAPGWYDGGRPMDPLASLQAWDSWS